MEVILGCFFDNFEQSERNSLHARYKRQGMVEYFNTLIQGCGLGENCDPEKVVREAIREIIRFHQKSKQKNGGVCVMGKYHDVLYIAVKLSFDWKLKDSAIIVALLDEIFQCEKTFERILVGALFGTRAPFYIAGWKSDFTDQEENVRAMVYYLDHATTTSLEFPYGEPGDEMIRYIDVPIESCGKMTALTICVQLGLSDKLHILLRYGAMVLAPQDNENIMEWLVKKLYEFKGCYPFNFVACFQLLLRVLPNIFVENPFVNTNEQRKLIFERYPELVAHAIIPISRCGVTPVELKHLSRCAIRKQLWLNYALPNGIRQLQIPDSLHRYLDIMED